MRFLIDTNFVQRTFSGGLNLLNSNLSKLQARQKTLQSQQVQAQTAPKAQSKPAVTKSTPNPIQGLNPDETLLYNEAVKQGASTNQIAYILGTAKHESANFKTMTEYASGQAYEGRADLGNTQRGDGVKYKGAGYVQITGRNNYAKYSKILNKDLINNPALAKDKNTSAFITVHGILNGTFTGAKLGDYVNDKKSDFINARRTVNGLDQSQLIANYAQDYLKKIKK